MVEVPMGHRCLCPSRAKWVGDALPKILVEETDKLITTTINMSSGTGVFCFHLLVPPVWSVALTLVSSSAGFTMWNAYFFRSCLTWNGSPYSFMTSNRNNIPRWFSGFKCKWHRREGMNADKNKHTPAILCYFARFFCWELEAAKVNPSPWVWCCWIPIPHLWGNG